MAVIDGGKMIA